MRRFQPIAILAIAALVAGCGGGHGDRRGASVRPAKPAAETPTPRRVTTRPAPQALVTDERQGLLAVVNLPSGSARQFIGVPHDPEYAAAEPGAAVLTSPSAGAVTLLRGSPLRVVKITRGFGTPRVVELSADRRDAYITDDVGGTLTVIRLRDGRVVTTVPVGSGAHHMASSPDGRRLWIALGERARTIVILDASDSARPRVVGRFHPSFLAHDLAFSPDGSRVWITSADGPDVMVVRASDQRLLFRVPVGPPPQHVDLAGAAAYLTSGYGSTIERVSERTGELVRRVRSPYGSFELAAGHGFVTTSSLLDGTLAVYTSRLRLLHVLKLGPATRDVEVSTP
jgi:DNA-binding beta-propeller fold protein YncE